MANLSVLSRGTIEYGGVLDIGALDSSLYTGELFVQLSMRRALTRQLARLDQLDPADRAAFLLDRTAARCFCRWSNTQRQLDRSVDRFWDE